MTYHVPETLNADFTRPAIVRAGDLPWTPSPSGGVDRRFLDRVGGEVARATTIVRYGAGSSFSRHVHDKGEEFLVLSGVFSDETGDFPAGTYVRNPPGSGHAPFSRDGCIIFVKLRQMPDTEAGTVVVQTREQPLAKTGVGGLKRLDLYGSDTGEQVALEFLAPGTEWTGRAAQGGEEILVLHGDMVYGDERCGPETWLRYPEGMAQPIRTEKGCLIWVKRGHLPPA